MKYLSASLVLVTLATTGCAELHRHALGTRVNQFSIKGRDYIHCSILVDKAQPQMAHDALTVCEDGIRQAALPRK